MAMPDLASATPWGSIVKGVTEIATAGPAGPSQSGNIGGAGGIAPVSIAGFGGKASAAAFAIPTWAWIAAAVVGVLYVIRKK